MSRSFNERRSISGRRQDKRSGTIAIRSALALPTMGLLGISLSACSDETGSAPPDPGPVRTTTVEKREGGKPLILTGRIEAADQAALGFRIPGRMIERAVRIGAREPSCQRCSAPCDIGDEGTTDMTTGHLEDRFGVSSSPNLL